MNNKKIKKIEGKYYLELPEWAKEAEVIILDNAIFIYRSPVKKEKKEDISQLNEDEIELLWKVSLMPYSRRTFKWIKKELGEQALNIVKKLIRKRILNYRKDKDEIYVVYPQSLYQEMKKKTLEKEKIKESQDIGEYAILDEKSFKLVGEDIKPYYMFAKSFEGKIYAIKTITYKKLAKKIKNLLSKPMHISEIADMLGVDGVLVKIVVHFLAEAGEVYEMKKDTYAVV